MLQEFARCYELKMGFAFNVQHRHVRYVHTINCVLVLNHCSRRCLAHIINLATQALISTRSKSKYYSGDLYDDNLLEDSGASERDEIGLVRAICVKV